MLMFVITYPVFSYSARVGGVVPEHVQGEGVDAQGACLVFDGRQCFGSVAAAPVWLLDQEVVDEGDRARP